MNQRTLVCIPCRNVARGLGGTCQYCRADMHSVYYRIRLPKKNNDKAWALIEAGDWLWDKKHIAKKARKKEEAWAEYHSKPRHILAAEKKARQAARKERWDRFRQHIIDSQGD